MLDASRHSSDPRMPTSRKTPARKQPARNQSAPAASGPDDDMPATQKPARAERGPRRRVGVDGQRLTIVAGAMKVLETKSYEQLSVEDVLQAAPVSRQTFYRCFPNKNALFHQIFRDGNAMFLMAIKSLDKSGDDAVTVADRALTGGLLFVIHGGAALRALYRETIKPDSEFAPYRQEVFDALVGDITQWASGLLKAPVEPMLVRALLIAVEQLIFEMAMHGTPVNDELQRFRGIVRTLVDGTWRELQRQRDAR
jgi:AcrR family transcriptional regulator